MADPRFFKNLGPFTLAQVCEKGGIAVPSGVDASARVFDLAGLAGAAPTHLTFFSGATARREEFAASRAGFCLVPDKGKAFAPPDGMTLLPVASVQNAFAVVSLLFYPESSQPRWSQESGIAPDARLGRDVEIAPGVVIG
ncbi:MAG TPA: LpxD N-terminal domain-containing protein, partial [Rhizomicrobium sp.]|nr:LpxD N-terminal domain-containing protein [Rhizomicrobium sp.]